MTTNSTSSTNSKWTGMVPVDDTALAVTDTGGSGIPVVYLDGQFATQGYWRRVIAELGTGWRHITYDERARGNRSVRRTIPSWPPSGMWMPCARLRLSWMPFGPLRAPGSARGSTITITTGRHFACQMISVVDCERALAAREAA
jgi:hypothetical protein